MLTHLRVQYHPKRGGRLLGLGDDGSHILRLLGAGGSGSGRGMAALLNLHLFGQ